MTEIITKWRDQKHGVNKTRMNKGIILAGGAGTRLYPLTEACGKSLLPVHDKPMIYHPLSTLIEGGIQEICIISTARDLPRIQALLGTGRHLGLSLSYLEQIEPRGIAQAFTIAGDFIGEDDVALILGDNIFHCGDELRIAIRRFNSGCTVFGYQVKTPSRYGVVELGQLGSPISIEEKPANPKSNYAVPGLYLFNSNVVGFAHGQKPSARGELEITDIIRAYLDMGELLVVKLPRGFVWLDAGTSSSLQDASAYVRTIEERTGIKIGCPEEAALRAGFITPKQFYHLANCLPECEYQNYLMGVEP